MRTIAQALTAKIGNLISLLGGSDAVEVALEDRGLEANAPYSGEIGKENAFQGALADCLYQVATLAPSSFSESDISISLQDRDLILKKANHIYSSIGEEEKKLDQPKVYVGWPDSRK